MDFLILELFPVKIWFILLFALATMPGFAQPVIKPYEAACPARDVDAVNVTLPWSGLGPKCAELSAGFDSRSGSFSRVTLADGNLLHLGEILSVSGEYSERVRRAEGGFSRKFLHDGALRTSAAFFAERFAYNQARESSFFAFDRDIPVFGQVDPNNLIRYVSYSHGVTASADYRIAGSRAHVGLAYRYDISTFKPRTEGTYEFFESLPYGEYFIPALSSIRTYKLTPSFSYNTIDNPWEPTQGTAFSARVAIVNGQAHSIEPGFDVKHYAAGARSGHVVAVHLSGSFITGYGGWSAPPYSRYYLGGENDVRGFDSWSISPINFMPSTAAVDVLNNDGSLRQYRFVDPLTGALTLQNVMQTVPVYRPVSVGGDAKMVANFEYRIKLRGPLTLVLFGDAGANWVAFPDQLRGNYDWITRLQQEFPEAAFRVEFPSRSQTQKIRTSIGPELQVLVPGIRAPLRFYWAFNPTVYGGLVYPPIVADRSYFPNNATFMNALNTVGAPTPFFERRSLFRFSIGRSF